MDRIRPTNWPEFKNLTDSFTDLFEGPGSKEPNKACTVLGVRGRSPPTEVYFLFFFFRGTSWRRSTCAGFVAMRLADMAILVEGNISRECAAHVHKFVQKIHLLRALLTWQWVCVWFYRTRVLLTWQQCAGVFTFPRCYWHGTAILREPLFVSRGTRFTHVL